MIVTRKPSAATILLIGVALFVFQGCAPEPTATPTQVMPTATLMILGPEPPPESSEQSAPTATLPQGSTNTARPTSTATPTRTKEPNRAQPPQEGNQAFDFALSDLQGDQALLSSFQGKKVMLNFWATWCGPCRLEIPHMVALYEDLRDEGFEIVAINMREDTAKVANFVSEFEMEFPILLDITGQVSSAYYIRAIPTSLFLDEHGVIQAIHVGTLTKETLHKYVNDLMQP